MTVDLDPITREVIRNKLEVIAQEMEVTLVKSAYSSIVKEGHDASAALYDPRGEMVAQATALPAQLGVLSPAVRRVLERFPADSMKEGDTYILNDPYDGGSHLPDIAVIAPIVRGDRVIGLAGTIAHHQDLGGKTPGSIPTDSTEIYQEGLRIPVMRLVDAGRPVSAVYEILARNVRVPDIVLGDLRAQQAALHVGATRLLEEFDEHGDDLFAYMADMLDRSERMTRSRLEAIPDGSYSFTDYLDDDGIDIGRLIPITATVTVSGSTIDMDFTGTSEQVKGPVNSDTSAVMSAVYFVLRAVTGADIPNNGGCYRPLTVNLPSGTLVNPEPPAPVNGRTITMKRVSDVLLGAMVQAIPDRIPAAPSGLTRVLVFGGIDPRDGRRFVCADLGTGGTGGRPGRDGVDSLETDIANTMNMPAEAQESEYPLRVRRSRLLQDSAGAGRWRGGLGVEREIEVLADGVMLTIREDRHRTRAWGLFGGLPAAMCRAEILYANGDTEVIPSKGMYTLNRGDRVHCWGAGGAGYGDPLEREPEAVLRDVLDHKISRDAADRDYAVVLRGDPPTVDEDATKALRATRGDERGPIDWTYDRGEMGRE